jgi:hypothetical protein
MSQTQAENYLYRKELDDGREIVVYPMLFTDRLCIGVAGDGGYERAWCYPRLHPAGQTTAVIAAEAWDGEGDPPVGWIKEVGTERRRVDGDPEREYDASREPKPA